MGANKFIDRNKFTLYFLLFSLNPSIHKVDLASISFMRYTLFIKLWSEIIFGSICPISLSFLSINLAKRLDLFLSLSHTDRLFNNSSSLTLEVKHL